FSVFSLFNHPVAHYFRTGILSEAYSNEPKSETSYRVGGNSDCCRLCLVRDHPDATGTSQLRRCAHTRRGYRQGVSVHTRSEGEQHDRFEPANVRIRTFSAASELQSPIYMGALLVGEHEKDLDQRNVRSQRRIRLAQKVFDYTPRWQSVCRAGGTAGVISGVIG